jgi:hypothetical protein
MSATASKFETAKQPRLLYLVSEDWYFLSHRLPMARAARAAGYEVHVATRVVDGGAAITAEGFVLHPLHWRRGSTNPIDFVKAVTEVRRVYRALAPDLVHQVAFWPSIVGSLSAAGLATRRVSALAGLGFAFTSNALKAAVSAAATQRRPRGGAGPKSGRLCRHDGTRHPARAHICHPRFRG